MVHNLINQCDLAQYSESDHLVEEVECEQDLEGGRGENADVGHHLGEREMIPSISIKSILIFAMIRDILSITVITLTTQQLLSPPNSEIRVSNDFPGNESNRF